ncbi:MAG: RsmE family RNA methyltransferase [Chlamydiota bacterium]
MPHDRFYIDAPFRNEETVSIEDAEWHHLVNVSRAKSGQAVDLVNGRGQLAHARISQLNKKSADLIIEEITNSPKEAASPIILALALPRMNHLEWVVEKGTELNASAFWLFPGMLSEKSSLSPSQQQRLKHLSVAAMKQCGRLDLPKVELKPPLLQWQPLSGTLLYGDVSPDAPYLWELPRAKAPVILFIGPESGFSSKEEAYLRDSLGAKGVRLHPNILRAETAPLVGLSLIQLIIV